jgi:hypothetical protein
MRPKTASRTRHVDTPRRVRGGEAAEQHAIHARHFARSRHNTYGTSARTRAR